MIIIQWQSLTWIINILALNFPISQKWYTYDIFDSFSSIRIPFFSSLVPKIQLISTGWSSIWPLEPHQKSRMVPCFMYLAVFRGFKTFNQAVKPALKQRIWLVDHMGPKNIIFHFNKPKLNRQSWLIERSGKRVITESTSFSTCNEKNHMLEFLMDCSVSGFRAFKFLDQSSSQSSAGNDIRGPWTRTRINLDVRTSEN